MNSKIRVFGFIVLISLLISCKSNVKDMEKLIQNNDFNFTLRNKNGSYGGYISNKHDNWECNFGRDYLYFGFDSREIYADRVEVSYLSCNFLLYGEPSYRMYGNPQKTTISITKQQIIKRIHSLQNEKYDENEDIEKNGASFKIEPRGLSIADNIRIRETPGISSDIRILGKLNKFQKVTVIDETENQEEIEGIKSTWYKIITDEGIEGWVFGGFVKIYLLDEDIELLHKAFEKEGSEYTNQFVTPDYS